MVLVTAFLGELIDISGTKLNLLEYIVYILALMNVAYKTASKLND